MSKPIVVIACMLSSSESWEPQTAPTSLALTCRWRSRPQHQEATYAPQQTAPLFDHLVGALLQERRHLQPEGLGGLEIDDEVKLGWLHHGQIARLGALEDPAGVGAGLAIRVSNV